MSFQVSTQRYCPRAELAANLGVAASNKGRGQTPRERLAVIRTGLLAANECLGPGGDKTMDTVWRSRGGHLAEKDSLAVRALLDVSVPGLELDSKIIIRRRQFQLTVVTLRGRKALH